MDMLNIEENKANMNLVRFSPLALHWVRMAEIYHMKFSRTDSVDIEIWEIGILAGGYD